MGSARIGFGALLIPRTGQNGQAGIFREARVSAGELAEQKYRVAAGCDPLAVYTVGAEARGVSCKFRRATSFFDVAHRFSITRSAGTIPIGRSFGFSGDFDGGHLHSCFGDKSDEAPRQLMNALFLSQANSFFRDQLATHADGRCARENVT